MPRVVHFEISADDPQRAINFYQAVCGWEIQKWDGPMDYWLVTTGPTGEPGINGAIMQRNDPTATMYNVIDVPSIDEFVQKVEAHGGEIVLPKMTVPGIGYAAYVKDTEGNIFGAMEDDPSAQ